MGDTPRFFTDWVGPHTCLVHDKRESEIVAASKADPSTPQQSPDPVQHTPTQQGPTPQTHSPQGKGRLFGLALAALGIVFGDIGTSPLYSVQTVFALEHNTIPPDSRSILGVISMITWTLVLIVCIKYLTFVMRADNEGEGGILALMALIRHTLKDRKKIRRMALLLGLIGASLFYGDSMITPAISVMSAIEGLSVINPAANQIVLPAAILILTVLFAIQRKGTARIGRAFGPIMTIWFLTLACLGVPWIVRNPQILKALSPHYAALFWIDRPWMAFISMGAVVLTITGTEALYADMGHVGAKPIRLSWFCLVGPALLLDYYGQGAMLLMHPDWIDNPFFRLAPSWGRVPLVLLATMATIIAAQAVISGTFSLSYQASRMGLLPRLSVKHTSKEEGGQIYIPEINWILYCGVLVLIAIFKSSARLATAYGLAVTGTEMLTTTLFLTWARCAWRWPKWSVALLGVIIYSVEATIFSANLLKIASGGWIPLVISAITIVVMTTWRRGTRMVYGQRALAEGPLEDFLDWVRKENPPRVPGLAVYPHPDRVTTPLAMRNNTRFNHVLHEHNVILSIVHENVPHIRHKQRVAVTDLGDPADGISYVECHVGFADSQDVPKALALAYDRLPDLNGLDITKAVYFLSVADVKRGDPTDPDSVAATNKMVGWRKMLYVTMNRNQADRTKVFRTPRVRSVVLGEVVEI